MKSAEQCGARSASASREGRWAEAAATATWIVGSLPPLAAYLAGEFGGAPAAAFAAAFVVFGAALLLVIYPPRVVAPRRRVRLALVACQSLAALVMIAIGAVYGGGTGATSALLVIVAAELPHMVTLPVAWAGVALQTLGLAAVVRSVSGDWADTISFTMALGGFQAFALASSYHVIRESAARQELAAAHRELQAAHARLAVTSRAEERLRISRDLHDSLGHHLTALSLQLDVASRLADERARAHIDRAHAISRLLLGDVREVVSSLRDSGPVDLAAAVRRIAHAAPPELAVHLELPGSLVVDDRARGDALARCVQEIVTNATRHARARNLWVRLDERPDGIAITARDDGHGAGQVIAGHGLTGMRERFEALAGSVEFETTPEAGFAIRGFMPMPRAAS